MHLTKVEAAVGLLQLQLLLLLLLLWWPHLPYIFQLLLRHGMLPPPLRLLPAPPAAPAAAPPAPPLVAPAGPVAVAAAAAAAPAMLPFFSCLPPAHQAASVARSAHHQFHLVSGCKACRVAPPFGLVD